MLVEKNVSGEYFNRKAIMLQSTTYLWSGGNKKEHEDEMSFLQKPCRNLQAYGMVIGI